MTKSVLRTTVTLSGAIDLSPIQVFNAAPSAPFSAAAELGRLRPGHSRARGDFPGEEILLVSFLRSPSPFGRGTVPARSLRRPSPRPDPLLPRRNQKDSAYAKKKGPSKSASGWLNLQWSLRPIAPLHAFAQPATTLFVIEPPIGRPKRRRSGRPFHIGLLIWFPGGFLALIRVTIDW